MRYDTAGDPMTGLKWTKRTTRKIAEELSSLNIHVSHRTVGKLLRQLGFSLGANQKQLGCGKASSAQSKEDRNRQFDYISSVREAFAKSNDPTISVDSKKKEMVGSFRNNGRVWTDQPIIVNDHDFRSDALGMAVPYGIYDTQANRGRIVVGTSSDTPAFAVGAIAQWWQKEGMKSYPKARKLLILADGGGSNGSRPRGWKYHLQHKLCDQSHLEITVCHYPTGTSKWNPIEHRMFSEVSKNWAGRPLDSYETVLKYIRTTKTTSGLRVTAELDTRNYEKGESFSKSDMDQLALVRHETLPSWNYSLHPR